MSRFLGQSSRGGIQSSSLSDGTLSMSNGQIDGVITINGVSPAMISQNTAAIASNASSIAALPNISSAISASSNIGTTAFDVADDDPATDKVLLGTPFFPLYINSSEVLFGNGEMTVNQLSIKNRSATAADIAETKFRIRALHDTSSIGTNLLDNYIDFVLHQSLPLSTGGYLALSGNGNADLVRFYYGGSPAERKKTDFMGGVLEGCHTINGISPAQITTNATTLLALEARLAVLESLSPPLQLKANDGTEFVIQQTDYPGFYMEQRDKRTDATGAEITGSYENASLLLFQSDAQVSNSSGIKWTCTYTSSTDTYEFTNVKDTAVKLGLQNSWYVTGAGNTNMNIITNTQISLTATGAQDEYTITQVIGSGMVGAGVTVTLASIYYDLSHETIDGQSTVTARPMTWFEYPGTNPSKFRIRPY